MITEQIRQAVPTARMILVFLLKLRLALLVLIIPDLERAVRSGLYRVIETAELSRAFAKLKGKSTIGSSSVTIPSATARGIPMKSIR